MQFRYAIIGLSCLLAVAACGGDTYTVTYDVHTTVTDTGKQQVLFPAAERVVGRKLASIDITNARISVLHFGGEKATLSVGLKSMEQVEAADALVQEKLTFDIRIEEAPATTTTDAVWKDTGVTAKQLEWIQPLTNPTTNEVGVELSFTDEGKAMLEKAFNENPGKNIGIFVRGLLVSKMTISNTPLTSSHIIIGGIPSAKVAEIFSEDVNVGIHLTFTPVP